MLKSNSVITKVWNLLRTYILTVPRFDLNLQGALLIMIALESNVYLLLKRDAETGYHPMLVNDWVYLGTAITEIIFAIPLSWCGSSRRHLSVAFWLAITGVAGLTVLAFPFAKENPQDVELCSDEAIMSLNDEPTDSLIHQRTVFLVLTAVLCTFTKVIIWAHGLTYLDDHEPHHGPYFNGILISIRLSLGLSAESWLKPGANRDDWWVAHIALSLLLITFAFFFTLFPKRMAYYQPPEPTKDTGFMASVLRVLRNKAIFMQIGAISLLATGLFGFIDFNEAYIQARYHIETQRPDPRTPTLVTTIFRPMVIIFFVMIFRMRFSVRRKDGVKANTSARVGGVVAVFTAAFFIVLAALNCDIGVIEGTEVGQYDQPTCSEQCDCNSIKYGFAPVCGKDTFTTYFSPCHAGCTDMEELGGLKMYQNCTCVEDRAISGACTLLSCMTVYGFYQAFFAVVLAVAGAALLMQGMVFLRAVDHQDKAIAFGVAFAGVALLQRLLGHLLYMLISDLNCMYENDNACVLHRPTLWWMPTISAVFCILSAIVSIMASIVAYPAKHSNSIETSSI